MSRVRVCRSPRVSEPSIFRLHSVEKDPYARGASDKGGASEVRSQVVPEGKPVE